MNKTFNNIKDCSFVSPTGISYLPYENISTFDVFFFYCLMFGIRNFWLLLEISFIFFKSYKVESEDRNCKLNAIKNEFLTFFGGYFLIFVVQNVPRVVSKQVKVLALLGWLL